MLLCGGDKIQLEHLSEVEHFNKNILISGCHVVETNLNIYWRMEVKHLNLRLRGGGGKCRSYDGEHYLHAGHQHYQHHLHVDHQQKQLHYVHQDDRSLMRMCSGERDQH